jgi:hypothetical protein
MPSAKPNTAPVPRRLRRPYGRVYARCIGAATRRPMQKHSAQARDAPQRRVAGSPKRDRRPASLLLWRRSRQCPRRYRVPGNATVLSARSSAALRSRRLRKGGPQDTQNGPPSVASRKYGPSSAMPSYGRLSDPLPLSITPYLVQRDATPRVGQAPCRGALPLARPGGPSRVRVVRKERRRLIDLVSARPTLTDRLSV